MKEPETMSLGARSESDQLIISFPPGLCWGDRRLGDHLQEYRGLPLDKKDVKGPRVLE